MRMKERRGIFDYYMLPAGVRVVHKILAMANEKMLKNGPKTDANGLTQGSVSESKMEDDEEAIRAEEACSM